MPLRFLLLEDNPLDANIVEVALRDGGIDCELLQVETRADFAAALLENEFDLILADYTLPEFDGISALEIACHLRPDVPFIFVSGSLGEELAIETLKRGATDYVVKERLGRLVPSVQRALRETEERRERKRAELMLFEQKRLLELIASGRPLNECLKAMCTSMSELHPGTRACFLLTNSQGTMFKSSITPDFPSSFGEGLKDAPINDLCIGTCGEAAYRGEPITCADIVNDDRWSQEWRNLCAAHGILACHSKPVMGVDGVALGSLMLCFDQSRMPTGWELQLADFGTKVASIVFERDRSYLALGESEAKYRTLFESIDQGFCICEMVFDENGKPIDYRFVKVNPAFETIAGLKQATGKTARELVPNLEASWFEIYGKVVLTGEPIRFEAQSIAMNNRWFDVNAFCIDAAPSHKFAILLANISDRKQAEAEIQQLNQQLTQSLNELQTLFDLLPIGVAIAEDLECRTIRVNSYLSKLVRVPMEANASMGAPADEHPLYRLCRDGQDIPIADLPMQYAAIHNTSVQDEVVDIVHTDGTVIKLLCYASPLLDENHAVRGVVGGFVDITDRELSEQQIQRTLQTLQTLIAASPLPIVIIEPDCIVQLWNPAAERLFGWSEAEVLGKPIPIVPPEKQDECRLVREAVSNGEIFSGVETYRCKRDGSTAIVSISAALLDDSNAIVLLFQDITERQQVEEALRSSQAQLQTLFDEAPLGVFLLDEDFRIRQVNPTALPAFGDIPDLLGRDFEEVMHILWSPAYADEVVQQFRHTLQTGEPYFVPERIEERRDRGIIEYYEWRINRIPLPEGSYGVVCYFRDISAQVLARIAIAESESRFRLMVESAKDYAIFTLDLNGIIASWNSGAQKLLGYTETEAIGRNAQIIFTPEDNEQKQAEWEMETALTQERAENECWHLRKDGTQFWASGLMMPLQSEAGNIHGFVKILQDKTAKRQAEERLHLLYEMTRDLLAAEHPMQLMNNLFSKLSQQLELHCYYNYRVEEKDNRPMLHLKSYAGISDDVARSIEWIEFGRYVCGLVVQQQRQIILDAGQISTHPNAQLLNSMKITAYACQPLILRGRLLGSLSFGSFTRTNFTLEEINLLKSTCDQIAIALERADLLTSMQQQAEQLQQANRIKDEFLAVLSHELRSPLNPILGWSQMLKTGKLNEAKTAEALNVIERNAKLQSELIEDLLDVSRILRGKLSLNVSRVDLATTVQAGIETVRLAAQAKSIEIEARLEPNVGLVSGDANRLQQVIWNLLSNAVKFTDVGGQVEIRLQRLDGFAEISVSDTGKGIHPDFLPHVFDYFRQEDGATTRKFGGLGLGLAIVRHLVELHGGSVWAESPGEGQGAIFTVRLPSLADSSPRNPDGQQSEPSRNLQGIKILVVDDDTDTREFLTFLLQQNQANVTAVASAVEAIASLSESAPDVLVSDIGMPEVDGYMLMRQVRALVPAQKGQIKAIALTAYAGEIDYQQAMLAGFQCHVPKPVEPEVLVKAIADLVQQVGS
ncbi:histidine kinase [Nostoc sp. DSM 114161]|jgi:PAS domain S-box-containing protein|uniref:PAS domain S-box protein n=1 Tax=Nostoc sp. DSM 114161 TaxID=3440143 RepID=UPI0040455A80